MPSDLAQKVITVASSAGSAGMGLLAQATDVPGSTWLAAAGIAGAVLAPIAIQVLRWAEGREKLLNQVEQLRQDVSRNSVSLMELQFIRTRSETNSADIDAICKDPDPSNPQQLIIVKALRLVQQRSNENAEAIRRLECALGDRGQPPHPQG